MHECLQLCHLPAKKYDLLCFGGCRLSMNGWLQLCPALLAVCSVQAGCGWMGYCPGELQDQARQVLSCLASGMLTNATVTARQARQWQQSVHHDYAQALYISWLPFTALRARQCSKAGPYIGMQSCIRASKAGTRFCLQHPVLDTGPRC